MTSKLMEDLIMRERAEASVEARREVSLETARRMLADGLAPDIVSRCSGLTLDEVKLLQNKKTHDAQLTHERNISMSENKENQTASTESADMLKTIFAMQKTLNDDIASRRKIDFDKRTWLQKNILATISELSEVLDEIGFKWWKDEKPIDDAKLLEELTDVLHFFVSLCLHAGFSAEDLFSAYCEKNKVNFDRQRGLTDKPGYKS